MPIVSRREITVPNILTLLRIIMALVSAIFFMRGERRALAASILIVASLLDYFDGWYARKFHQTTRLGSHLDPFADKVLISVIFIALSFTFRWNWFSFFVAVMLFREVLITVFRMRVRRKSGDFIPASRLGKLKTTVQCVVGDSLLFYIFIHPGRQPSHNYFIFALMMLTMFITVDSGLRYLLPCCSDGKKRSALERLIQWIFGVRAREV
ncbi:MAG: CDP-diacylglycerol--glycerol-3-phosphate 3-phosphatidyltransferase [Candidatus Krumholzibacteriota bacterium]|nr:CDP-diacylglycerol--glycerol-3-phosphate 3-phosphatidyltransferase [Candidatus Krumholzibacteriota bacterium]